MTVPSPSPPIASDVSKDWLPDDWLPDADMRRIHLHWTAGGHRANVTDLRAYHLLIEGCGTLRRGLSPISANDPARRQPADRPAAHTRNANSHAIGLSFCAMMGAQERPFDPGPAPLTKIQWQVAIAVIARLAQRYGIAVSPRTVLTHAEVATNLGIAQRAKWDIARLPFDPQICGAAAVGARLRQEVDTAITALAPALVGASVGANAVRVVGTGGMGVNVRISPGGAVLRALPEGALLRRLGVHGAWWRVQTSDGRAGWVAARYLTS